MTPRTLLVVLVSMGICALPAVAAPLALLDPNTNDPSGWNVTWDESVVSVTAVEVDLNASILRIRIEKDFGPYEIDEGDIEFPEALITFGIDSASGQTPTTTIIVQSETIANHTGLPLNRHDWIIMEPAGPVFLIAESGGWTASPLDDLTWVDPSGNTSRRLIASGGVVANGATFTPQADLVIQASGDAPFRLKEIVAPEPSCLAILGAALFGLLGRRRSWGK